MNYQNDNNSNIHKPCSCPSPTANSLNVVQTTPSIVSVNSAIPLDTVVNSNGTAISFTPPTTVLLEGGRTYLAIYEVQVIIQPGGNSAGITMYLNNNSYHWLRYFSRIYSRIHFCISTRNFHYTSRYNKYSYC